VVRTIALTAAYRRNCLSAPHARQANPADGRPPQLAHRVVSCSGLTLKIPASRLISPVLIAFLAHGLTAVAEALRLLAFADFAVESCLADG
jgi:hypothetical protein